MIKEKNIYALTYEWLIYIMSAKENKKNKIKLKKVFKNPIVSGLIITIICVVANYFVTINVMENDISHINQDIEDLKADIKSINSNLLSISLVVTGQTSSSNDMANQDAILIDPSTGYKIEIENINNEILLASASPLPDNYDLYNTPFIVSYEENGKKIYFYGQFNENNNWNEKCILNIYNGDNLESIFVGYYNDGTLLKYNRVSCDDGETWTVTERINNIEYNSGETRVYTKTTDFINSVDINKITKEQILEVDDFEIFLNLNQECLLSYYLGNTSNGYYNDNTGYAYLIKYFDNDVFDCDYPVIQTIYQGNFVDGQFDDDSYNAWYIVREINTGYMFYRGCFSDGKVDHRDLSKEIFENNLSYEQIEEKLSKYGFYDYLNSFLIDY